ncbi:MAG: alpha-2-macroglobulin [Akkermansiaceae bacterium]|nr:alpha-2-macroglobulin [Akkermansiaceae bacterium]MCP5546255.1 alpha-2-macroglobulin [Akkermansiaceae bacterium]
MKTLLCFLLSIGFIPQTMAQDVAALRKERDKLNDRGMHREVVDLYRDKLMDVSDERSGEDLRVTMNNLQNLNAWEEFDPLVETAIERHPRNAAFLVAAAREYLRMPHGGRLIAGDFERTPQRWQGGRGMMPGRAPEAAAGSYVDTSYRDKVRALQLLRQALPHAEDEKTKRLVWEVTGSTLQNGEAWKLQTLTPIDDLPEWGEPGPEGGTEGAPWSGDGPVLYQVPESWETARNDGERWRFALAERAKLDRENVHSVTLEYARFTRSQFGVLTLRSFGWWRARDGDAEQSLLEMDTLAEDECLAKTSDGIRRFKLPEEHHFIALYRKILAKSEQAGDDLVQAFLDRRQYVKAREVLEETIRFHGPGTNDRRRDLLKQITGNWGRFEVADTVSAGHKPRVPLVFRNATAAGFTAAPVDVEAVLADTIDYIKGNPKELDWQRTNPSALAQRLIREKKSKYIGKTATEWNADLKPRDGHRDTRADIEVPVDKAGAWWITCRMKDGNAFQTLVWIVDSVLVKRDVAGKIQWWVADAESGAPVDDSDISFFGYRMIDIERENRDERRYQIKWKEFERKTDADGRTLLAPGDWDTHYQWLAIARKEGRAPAFFGFQSMHLAESSWGNANRDMTYGITDRPLYKPGDTVHLKFFLRNLGYFEPDDDRWAGQEGELVVQNGRGEGVVTIGKLRTDDLGAMETEFTIPKDASLGRWNARYQIGNRIAAGVSFRVEEYRKPEYEVSVEAPDKPVLLGGTFTAKVKANYFHGAPVRNATVEVIVKRESLTERWFPGWRWDWLYGRGAWWNNPQATWHPGWSRWGCIPPPPPWWGGDRWTPDELVIKKEMPIGPDGTAEVVVDTAPAKMVHGDMDSRYTIEARVVDASRREERGTGSVIAARKPFEVVVWTDRGYAKTGEAVEARISCATLAGTPVSGAKGKLVIYQVSVGGDGRLEEKEIQSWPVETNADGEATQSFPAPATGQYRLAATLTYQDGDAVEGASIFNVHGPGRADPADWKFGPLELVSDKLEYAPGETAKLRVNSDRTDAHVWMFLHIAGPAGREAKRIQLDGKSSEIDVPLDLRDMPNMFVEAVTVHGAQVHKAVKEILLPPASKAIEVTLEPAKDRVKPREKSSLAIILRDENGEPVSGEAVVAIYDKSLEAITGGSNVGPILENFWEWKNSYQNYGLNDSLLPASGVLIREGQKAMSQLGSFGDEAVAMAGARFGGVRSKMARGMDFADATLDVAPASAMMAEGSVDAFAAGGGGGDGQPEVVVRKDFADLLKWSGSVKTGADGRAEVPLEFPDNLTTWKARVWTLLPGTRVGEGSAEIITSKELLVRLQAPRFLVERDESVFSAVVHNDHDAPKKVTVSLELDGGSLEAIDGAPKTVAIAANSETRVDWRVKALKEGEAVIRMKADAGDDGDAVERTLPVLVHGMLRQDAWSRVVEGDSETIGIEVPEERRPEQTKLTIRFSPSIATSVVDAIPYLASYPHGCTEQTLNRFVPTVIAQRMLEEMGVSLDEVKAKRTNLNPQELGNAADRAEQWKRWQDNPVFDEAEVEKMVARGVEKLTSMQNSDGGWGWFSGYGEQSWPHTTAVVVHGLLVAKENGAEVPDRVLQSGVAWLMAYERQQVDALQFYVERQALRDAGKKLKPTKRREKARCDSTDAFVRMILGGAKRDSEPMLAFLYRDRKELPVYAKCLVGLEQHRKGDEARRDELVRMVAQYLKRDEENQTAYLDLQKRGSWWFWYGSEVEANAWYLKLLSAVNPKDADTRGLAKYLVNNRKNGSYWNSTRDTAYAIEAIAAYAKASGEQTPDMEVEVVLDGKSLKTVSITKDNLFSFDGTVLLTGGEVTAGKHQIELRRSGKGTLYANAYLEVFTLEEKLRAAGLEVKVKRRVSKLIELEKDTEVPDASGLVVSQHVERFRREPLADGTAVKSGDRIEVELVLESKNDYEYLIFSDHKAAGFEALDALSGYVPSSEGFRAYMEPRDETVDFFIRALPRGTHTLRYQLRAEAPGNYKALPATAEAMYAPELRGNSEDIRLVISGM